LYVGDGEGAARRSFGSGAHRQQWSGDALAAPPEHACTQRGSAPPLNALNRYAEADASWTRALELEPGSSFAQQGREETRRLLNEVSQDAIAPGESEPPPPSGDRLDAERWWEWGRALLSDERPDLAAEAFQQAIASAPDWSNPRADLGTALERSNRWADAAEAHAEHLALEPERVDAACNYAECLRK